MTADSGRRKDVEDEPHSKNSQEGVHNEKNKHFYTYIKKKQKKTSSFSKKIESVKYF